MKKYSDELFVSQTTKVVGYLCRSVTNKPRRKKRSGMRVSVKNHIDMLIVSQTTKVVGYLFLSESK